MKRYFLYGPILVFLFAFTYTAVFSGDPIDDPIRHVEEYGCCKVWPQGMPDYILGVWIIDDGEWKCECGPIYNPNNCPRRCLLYY